MWTLLKTEVSYSRGTWLNLFLQSFLMFLVLHFWPVIRGETPRNPNIGYNSIHHMLAIFIVMVLISPWTAEKRTRRFVTLPVRLRSVAFAHLFLFLFYWLSIVFLFCVYTLVSSRFSWAPPTPVSLLSQTGLVLLVYGLFFSGLSLSRMMGEKPARQTVLIVMGLTVFGLLFLAVAGVIHNFQNPDSKSGGGNLLAWIYSSPAASLVLLAAGLAALAVRWRLFMKSSSHTA